MYLVTNFIPSSSRTDPCSRLFHFCFVLRELSIGACYNLCCSVCSMGQDASGGKTGQHEKWEPKFLKAIYMQGNTAEFLMLREQCLKLL